MVELRELPSNDKFLKVISTRLPPFDSQAFGLLSEQS